MINLEEEARRRRERLLSKTTGKSAEEAHKEAEEKKNESLGAKDVNRRSNNDTFEAPEGLLDAEGAEILSMDNHIPETLEAQAKAMLAQNEKSAATFFDLDSLVDANLLEPKNQNADLKREYERRMAGLEKQTKRAVVDIVRARLAAEEKESE